MASSEPAVTVIIASSCEAKREAAIWRAVESVLSQEGVRVDLHLVVNGTRFDPVLRAALEADSRFRVHYQDEGSYPNAVWYGRTLVTGAFFAYLDDDDEYLPHALRMRAAPMLSDATLDVVATNGWLEEGNGDVRAYEPSALMETNPLLELLRKNWLQPCGHLFRSATVTLDFFDRVTKYYEWTLLGFKLSQHRRVRFLDVPTYRKHDSPESLYKSAGVVEGAIVIADMMLALTTDPAVVDRLAVLRCRALHAASDFHRLAGRSGKAWSFHLRSLANRHGWIHLPYTRRLLRS